MKSPVILSNTGLFGFCGVKKSGKWRHSRLVAHPFAKKYAPGCARGVHFLADRVGIYARLAPKSTWEQRYYPGANVA